MQDTADHKRIVLHSQSDAVITVAEAGKFALPLHLFQSGKVLNRFCRREFQEDDLLNALFDGFRKFV